MTRIPLAVPFKTRTGAPADKDAKLRNSYVEVKNGQTVVRKRPACQGGVEVGTGTAQGGIGLVIAGVPYVYVVNGDEINGSTLTGGAIGVSGYGSSIGTSWAGGTSYVIGDHVAYDFVDYWALTDHTGSTPPSANWSTSYVPADYPAITYATWNPADKGSGIVLSGGDLVATIQSTSSVRSTIGKSSGKWYWENTITTFDFYNNASTIGIGTSGANMESYLGSDILGWAYAAGNISSGYVKINNNTSVVYGAEYYATDIIGIALDMDAGTLEFYLNGISKGVAYSGLSGSMFAAVGGTAAPTMVVTTNFGASAFAYSVPSGYNSGLYT